MNWYLFHFITMMISASYMIAILVFDYKWEDWSDTERDTERTTMWWVFNVLCFMTTYIMTFMNGSFLWYAFWDANRRIFLMKQVSNSLEMDFV